ncbi:hypothetical protein VTI74DRAFT_2694 [Chaetomium olivicolor]
MIPPLITLEEHLLSPTSPPSLTSLHSEQLAHIPHVLTKLTDLSSLRLADMDSGGVALQVISHVPGLGSCDASACRAANDHLAAAIRYREGKGRFAGFAVLPMREPAEAARELRRCVRELGFVGALVDNHVNGRFYDGEEYSVFWGAVEELGVPVYLHPVWPSEDMMSRYEGSFGEAAAKSMSSSGWGWHSETGLHVLRLYASGLFDRRPGVKIVIGHMGEMIPFMLERIETLSKRWGTFERGFRTVYDENIWITTSGVWSVHPMRCILANTKLEHILYSVDYPFQSQEVGLEWMKELEESGLVDEEQLKAIAHGNAEKLLGVKLPDRHRRSQG